MVTWNAKAMREAMDRIMDGYQLASQQPISPNLFGSLVDAGIIDSQGRSKAMWYEPDPDHEAAARASLAKLYEARAWIWKNHDGTVSVYRQR